MAEEIATIWSRIGGNTTREPLLLGRKISADWLKNNIELVEVRFTGDLFKELANLLSASKAEKKNLPVTSLRTALIGGMEKIVALDRDLGLQAAPNGRLSAAVSMFSMANDADERMEVRKTIVHYLMRWVMDELEPWAERSGMGGMVSRLKSVIDPQLIELTDVTMPMFLGNERRPNFPLIARTIGERLIGEKLFEGLTCCELVASPESRSNAIELMTLPERSKRGDDFFSMVARISVCTMPYSNDISLGVSAMKRVWAKKVPFANSKMPRRVTGYVMAEGRPAIMVPVERSSAGWEFGDGYAAVQAESRFVLKPTLAEAIAQREYDPVIGWWAGLPELPTLFKYVSPRTVFEGDEATLLGTVSELLETVLVPRHIPLREISINRQKKPLQEMLRLTDLEYGTAGDSLVSEADGDDDEEIDESSEVQEQKRSESLQHYRNQNIRALKLAHGDRIPVLWVLGGSPREQEVITNSVTTLFGDAVTINQEPLPSKTHGLRTDLEGSTLKAAGRFDERLKHWTRTAETIKQVSAERPIIVLICAADKYNSRSEDPVNYYAGIHAMSRIGANVHHVLPIESPNEDESVQSFLHRTQSALLDVFLAHSGIIFRVKELTAQLIPEQSIPRCIYGIQALRSKARTLSGETGVAFILYSRLIVESGVTEVQIVYRAAGGNKRSDWMPLSRGLQWLGSQRQMYEGDDRWLKETFVDSTKETLVAIADADPTAIVMIDWQSVAGLWKGLRDEDLGPNAKPMLGNADLSAFGRMSFVRLRRGVNTLSLRSEVKTSYERLEGDDRVRTGEVFVDSYFSTNKVLVEVSDEVLAADKPYGHFIASMGYAKTVKVLRGFSCYRPSPRMMRMGSGVKAHEQKILDPAEKDAALPASMEITVLCSPPGVLPKNIAMLTMGLRIGYAHYNDWTTLPAPMFFRRKIEDYVIRFPEDEETPVVPDTSYEAPGEPAVEATADTSVESADGTRIARLLDEASNPVAQVEPRDEILLELSKSEKAVGDEDDLLTQAKAIEMPVAYTGKDRNQRILVQRMLQQDSHVRVRVDLPYWVRTNGIFGPTTSTVRHGAARCWRELRDFEFISLKAKKPSDNEFLNWLSGLLQVPQAAYMLVPACAKIGGIGFAPFAQIIDIDYNPGRAKEEQIAVETLSPETLATLTLWADEQGHDTLMGWLIFLVAQYPAQGWCKSVIDNITEIPGLLAEEALKYYLDVASAVQDAITQKDHLSKFQPVIRRRQKPTVEVVATPRIADQPPSIEPIGLTASASETASVVDTVMPVAEVEAVTEVDAPYNTAPNAVVPEITAPVAVEPVMGTPIVTLRESLATLIRQIEPGASTFEDEIAEIYSNLEAVKVLHRQENEKRSAEQVTRVRIDSLHEHCTKIIADLAALEAELEIGSVEFIEPPFDAMDAAEQSTTDLQAILGDIYALKTQLKNIDEMPATQSISERQKRTRIATETLDAIAESGKELKSLLARSECLALAAAVSTEAKESTEVVQTAVTAEFETIEETALTVIRPTDASLDVAVTAPIPASEPPVETPEKTSTASAEVTVVAEPLQPPEASVVAVEPPEVEIARPVPHDSAKPAQVRYTKLPQPPVEVLPPVVTVDIDDDTDEYVESGASQELIDRETDVLHKLLQRRLYGMASVHIHAMRPMLAEFSEDGTNSHHIVLRALIDSLCRMDCQFEFEPKLDGELRVLLESHSLTGNGLCDPAVLALGVMASGLSSMLFDHVDIQWNIVNAIGSRLVGHPPIASLIEHIDTIRQHGLILTRDMFISSHIGDHEAINQELARFQKRAAEWKTGPEIFTNWSHRGFRALHEELFGQRGVFGHCLDLIARGDSGRLKSAYEGIRKKFEKPASTIDEHFRKIGERARPEGKLRVTAIENVEATRRLVEGYLDHIRRRENPNLELAQNIQAFLATLHRRLEDAQLEIKLIHPQTKLGVLYCDSSLVALRCALRLYDNSQAPVCIPQDKQKLLVQVPINRDLMPALDKITETTPELCSPNAVLMETARWATEALSIDDNGENIDVALKEAMRLHVAAQRFLPAFHIESLLPRSMISTSEPLTQLYNKKKAAFSADLQHARQRVTHAMTLSALTQSEANRMQRVIEELQECLRPDRAIGHPDGESNTFADFPQASAVLRYSVLIPLEGRLSQVAKDLEDDLNNYVEESRGLSSAQDIQRVRAMLASDNAAVLRTAYDALAFLKSNHKLPGRIGVPVDIGSAYDQFIGEVHRSLGGNKNPLETLLDGLNRVPSDADPEWLRNIDAGQRADGAELITAWLELFASPRRDITDNVKPLEKVFHLLGINHQANSFPEHGRSNRMRFMLPERAFTFPVMMDGDMFIPPVLGSRATHIQGFMVFGTPQESDLRQLMHEVGATPTIVMARTRLNMQKRARISGSSPVLLVDDELVSYVALHSTERLQALMRIGILTFSTNPYDDYGGRPVPSEMFFGRQTELAKLRDVKSLGVLYGGRRLGKSSLLSQVERETNATPGSMAAHISMDTIDSSTDHVAAAWEFIYRNLLSRKIIAPMASSTNRWQSIRDWIEKEIISKPQIKSLYLLIDEADELMGRELRLVKSDTSFVRSLQQMVDNVQHACHVRYVIAGLHNMARMTTEENSVLGKAEPIALEPFSTPSDIQRGIRLITKPLAAMGYLFGEGAEDLPMRILSVCNSYPAFIQLYCKSLVDRLQNNRQEASPPTYIRAEDLDAVDNDSTLLTELRRKFELNLDLDKRYKAIALILADTYYSKVDDSHYQGLTVSEIVELCETFAPLHFANAGPGVLEALLDEMGKLNVVERIGTRYVLRNPNIAMMMGDRDRVSRKLDELAKEPPDDSRNHGERRVFMDSGTTRCLFPYPVSWVRRYMDSKDGELLILTGNDLSGILDLAKPAGKEEWKIGQDGYYTMLPGSNSVAAVDYIAKLRRAKVVSDSRRIVAVRPNSWTIQQIPDFVSAAAKAAKHDMDIRFVLLAMPERAYDLAMAFDAGTLAEEPGKWRIVPIPQWSDDAVYLRVHENTDISENSGAIAAIIDATCGFDREIQRLYSGKMTVEAALNAPKIARESFAPNLAEFYKKVGVPPSFLEDRRLVVQGFLEAINGAKRHSAEVEEVREMLHVTKGEMMFMQWMGLLQDGPAGTWRVPALYAHILSFKS